MWSSAGPRVQRSGTMYAIVVEGIMGTFLSNYFKFGLEVQEEMSFREKSLHMMDRRLTTDEDR